jgi:hypothetical protein
LKRVRRRVFKRDSAGPWFGEDRKAKTLHPYTQARRESQDERAQLGVGRENECGRRLRRCACRGCRTWTRGAGGRHQFGDGRAQSRDLELERGDVLRIDQRVIDRGDGGCRVNGLWKCAGSDPRCRARGSCDLLALFAGPNYRQSPRCS